MNAKILIIGATKGLGLELVREAEVRGAHSVAVGRKFFEVNRLVEEGEASFRNTFFVGGDVTDPQKLLHDLQPHLRGVTHLFLVAGNFSRKPFKDLTHEEIDVLYDVHLRGPRKFLNAFHRLVLHERLPSDAPRPPYHLVVVGSTSSWRMRDDEALYAEVQAAKAHFTRQFSIELARDLPGSKTTLVCPAGMATDFFAGTGVDTSKFMNPRVVAELVWDQVLHQVSPYQEMHIVRTREGEPIVQFGQKMPEAPNFGGQLSPKPQAPDIHWRQEGEMPPKPEPRLVRATQGKIPKGTDDPKDFGC